MEVFHYMRGDRHAISITLIGCGGTGSVLMQHLARINKSMIAQGNKGIILTCIDDDVVTPANLGRQLFTEADLGRFKSVVMVERCNRFYGTSWRAIPKRFGPEMMYNKGFPGNIIITCVDNVATRKQVYNYIVNCDMNEDHHESYKNLYWIDTGNGRDFGQVVLDGVDNRKSAIIALLDNMEKNEVLDDTPSCSLAEALDKQDLFINPYVALAAGEMVWDLTQQSTIEYNAVFINLKKQIPIRRAMI